MPPTPSSKNLPTIILHDIGCRDLNISNDKGAHHISMRAALTLWFDDLLIYIY
jgi:hypothetical protein